MWKTFASGVGVIMLAIVVLLVVLFAAMSVFDLPMYAWRIIRYGQSDIGDDDIFPQRVIANDTTPSVIERGQPGAPVEVEYGSYDHAIRKDNLADLLARTGTRAFLILKDDKLIVETYPGSSREDMHTSFSAAKSFNSALIGAAIADGSIGSVHDPLIQYIPEIAGRGFDQLTIRDLLRMSSGIRYIEGNELPFYMAPFADDSLTYYSPDLRRVALQVDAGDTPVGEAFHYNNYYPLLEGLLLERATGMHVAEYLQERLWKPMGAEFTASWSLDSEASGFEKMESGINARAIDFARFGLIFLHNGFWNGLQILPEEWVRELTEPLRPDERTWETFAYWLDYGGYYKYHWWGLNNADGSYDFYAHGRYDQIIYAAPRKNTVIVRFGDQLDREVPWPLVLQSIVDQLP